MKDPLLDKAVCGLLWRTSSLRMVYPEQAANKGDRIVETNWSK